MSTAAPSLDQSSSRLHADSLATSVALLLVMTVVQRSVGLGRGILFCRWLTPETLGEWEMAFSFLLLAAPLAVLGVPGTFGRYLEHYRQRGHLRTFLQRSALWTTVCSLIAVLTIALFAEYFSTLLFGVGDRVALVRGIALCLAAVIFQHTLGSLLTALRLFRVVTVVNFLHSMLFATLALALLLSNASVSSILIAYGSASLLAALGGFLWVWPGLKNLEHSAEPLPQTDFWSKLLKFAFFLWVANVLSHLFAVVDRYMIVHFSGMGSSEALDLVGHYHSSRIIPVLMISVAEMLSGLIMPHLSHDWEAGRRKEVGLQTRLSVKLTGIGMLGIGVLVLLLAPFLFEIVLEGKYSDGLEVLPWTLTACLCYGIYFLAQNYLWCAERARLATLPLALGLVVNIALNMLLLPMWGLLGAVVATALSTVVCLSAILLLNARHGMQLDLGIWMVIAAPMSLTVGPLLAGAVWSSLIVASFATNIVLNSDERARISSTFAELLAKAVALFGSRTKASREQ